MARTSPNGISKRIWLHLLKEGGWWTNSEIANAIDSCYSSVHKRTFGMWECGSVMRRNEDVQPQYSVMPANKIARDVTVAELMAARA